MLEAANIGTIDYFSLVAVLAISLGIGVYSSYRGNKSPEEYLMGNRSFGTISVAMSLLTTFVSAISLLGFSGEVYAFGIQIVFYLVGTMLGIATSAYLSLPVIYPLRLTSINEYLLLRFKSLRLQKVMVFLTTVQALLYSGTCLYAPTIALSAVTQPSSLTYILLLGIIVTIYSSIGGIRAVVWTDVFQLSVMLIGLIIITITGIIDVGGLEKVWNLGWSGERLSAFNFNGSLYERHNVYNIVVLGYFMNAPFYSVSQSYVQRVCAVKTIEKSKRVLWINVFGMLFIYLIIFGSGLIAYAAYADCDPMLLGHINRKEEILPFYVVHRLQYVTGLPGIFIATIIGGALSSLSSVLSSMVAILWKDCFSHFDFFARLAPLKASIVNKIIACFVGISFVGTAIIASKATGLIQFSRSTIGSVSGAVFGVYIIGFLFPKTNMKGVWSGLLISSISIASLVTGAFFHTKRASHLPKSTSNCEGINTLNVSAIMNGVSIQPLYDDISTTGSYNVDDVTEDSFFDKLFGISYTLYPLFGLLICLVVALTVSFLTGNQDLSEVSPECITPFARKYYWGKDCKIKLTSEHNLTSKESNDASDKMLP